MATLPAFFLLPARLRSSLIHRLSLTLWGLFLVLLLLLSLLGYAALRLGADGVVPLVLQRVMELKAQSNEVLLLQADASVRRLRADLLQRLEQADAQRSEQRFDGLFARSADGLWRVRAGQVDTERAPTLYLHDGAQGLSASARQRAVASYELLREQGPALAPPFFSVYMDFVEDGLMVYARGIDWGGNADAQASNANYPTMRGADPRRNPERKVFWTPAYLDEQARTWMVSVIAPLDWQGRWAGTLGHDLPIASLIDSVAAVHDRHAQQFILDGQAHLIAHPEWGERIAAAQGRLSIAELQDQVLLQLPPMMQRTRADSGAGRTPDGRHWVAWSRIRGPDWYQVIVLSQERVNSALRLGLAAVIGLALVVLMPALWWLRRRVRILVAQPLQRLTQAVDALGRGHDPAPIRLASANELGRLAAAFDTMAADLARQRARQAAQAQALQAEADERRQVMQRLHFQGVYHAQTGRLAHLEALVRMADEADPAQLIAPGQFIVHAEKSGRILDIDRWVVRESIRLLAAHPRLPAMAVNISGRSIDDPELPGFITAQLAAQGVAPRRLRLELTETAAVSDLGDAQRFIDALQRAGCTVCLDDFGTGFASFAYLKHLQAQVLKIDGLFVRNLPREHDNQVFVRSIIEVAHGMGKRAVAEFVEDAQTLQLLQGFGVDMVQGYHLGRPQAQHPALRGADARLSS